MFGVSFLSCDADVRTGGTYRFVFSHASSEQPMSFFGRYVEVTPHSRLVWTNDEGDEGGAVTTVTSKKEVARRSSLYTNSIPQKKPSTMQSPLGVQVGQASSSRNWTSFSSPWERAWDGHEVIDLSVGCPAMSGRPTSLGSSTMISLIESLQDSPLVKRDA